MSEYVSTLTKPATLQSYAEAVTAGTAHNWVDGQVGTADRFNKNVQVVFSMVNDLYTELDTTAASNKTVLDDALTKLDATLNGTGSVSETLNATANYVTTLLG
jgi:uncharacterized membrane protein YdfJ with MMPL/SSD domain